MLSGVTLGKKPYLCPCRSSELVQAMSGLCSIGDEELAGVLSPYQDSSTTLVFNKAKVDEVAGYLASVKGVERVFIDYNVVKTFTVDSADTFLTVKRGERFDLYLAHSDSGMMW